MLEHDEIIAAMKRWVESLVVDLNLCPFAKAELRQDRVRFVLSEAMTEQGLLMDLEAEIERLETDPATETSLLIHPCVLESFENYNQFLDLGDQLLVQMELDGVYQIASFHPNYQFAGTEQDDAENYTNRSPYPCLHLLREASLDRVLATTEHAEKIPLRNIALLNRMGTETLRIRLQACLQPVDDR